jgi:homoserine O-acetyltransferase
VEGDRLVPMDDAVALIEGLAGRGRLRVLRSPYGHDAFLKETDRINALLASELFTSSATLTPAPTFGTSA